MGVLDGARAKLGRANDHIEAFKVRAGTGPERSAYTVTVDDSGEDGWHILRAVATGQSLTELSLIAGDVLGNYRAAIDYVAFQLYLASGGDPDTRDATSIYYPVAMRPEDWLSQRGRFLRGVADDLAELVKPTQPCFRGDLGGRALADLAYFSRPDKHREPVAMGILSGSGIGLTFDFPGPLPPDAILERVHPVGDRPIDNAEIHRWRILRQGMPQTMTMLFGVAVNVQYHYALDIALSHGPRVCCALPVIGEEVGRIIELFDPILSK
jgi:hypothetical protein